MKPDSVTPCIEHGMTPSNKLGHAKVWSDGAPRWVHREAYCNHHGVSRESIVGKVVRHTCDNAYCINPLHLVLGTKADNNKDMAVRDRVQHGEAHAHSKLTSAIVREARSRYTPGCPKNGMSAMAREFGVSVGTLAPAIHGKTWRRA